MKLLITNKKALIFIIMVMLFYTGCELLDPTEVSNPSITQDKLFKDATGGAAPLITGLKYAFSDAVDKTTYFTDVVSDNYINASTYLSTQLDYPRNISPNDQYLGDDREIYFKLQTLNALANFGITTVLPKDAEATDVDKSTTYFYKGMAILMLCENFQAFPLEENGQMIRSEVAIKSAIEAFNKSYNLNPTGDNAINNKLALGRAYRIDGNKTSSVQAANDALALGSDYVFYANFDAINLQSNITGFLVLRTQQDMQPLPRLDFLDPKFNSSNGDDPIPVLKMEEAHLILAEAALSNGNLVDTKASMINALNLVAQRETGTYTDKDKRRNRPNNSSLKIKADASSEAISGLIFARSGATVVTHPISGTSVTEDYINSLSTSDDLFRCLYLMRQEIFFTEGRRMSDLGIRLPVMGRQIEANPNINYGDYGTSIYVPNYIPQNNDMDKFTVDDGSGVVTILHDMNKILAQNKSAVSKFF
jgi:hypothetical protein